MSIRSVKIQPLQAGDEVVDVSNDLLQDNSKEGNSSERLRRQKSDKTLRVQTSWKQYLEGKSSSNVKDSDPDDKSSTPNKTPKKRRRLSLAGRALRAAKQSILLRRSYQWRQGNDTKILASFCPSFLLQRLASKQDLTPHTFFGKGACLIADISGFVKLCGRLSALGVNGIDDLRKCTNSFIGDLVNTIYKRGGDVVSFAGDAIICVFMATTDSMGKLEESACCQNAIQCAVEIKNFTSVDLSCHVAVSYGEICFAILGGHEDKWTYLINGDCLTELSEALNDAGSKEAVATATCYAKADFPQEDIVVEEVPDRDSLKVTEVIQTAHDNDETDTRSEIVLCFSEMHNFVPSPVSASVAAGSFDILSELRQVTTLFLKLDSYCWIKNRDLLSLQPFFHGVQTLLEATGGYMRQFLVDDKGCVVIAIWGVPGTNHPNNCSRALHCGVSISQFCQTIDHSCSIGITTGDSYCGTVGSEVRQDYVAMGDAVNLAARLMCKADGRVLLDEFTYSELPRPMSKLMQKGEPLMLKGRTEPLRPFVYSGGSLPPLEDVDQNPEHSSLIVGREVIALLSQETATLSALQDKIFGQLTDIDQGDSPLNAASGQTEFITSFYPYVRVVMLVGPSGSGKGNSVELFQRLAKKHNFRHVALRVNQADGAIPYSTISKLFIQLVGQTHFITEKNQRDVVSNLLQDCYPNDDLDHSYRKHFPMLKFVLNLDWDIDDMPLDLVARAYEFCVDHTFQEVLSCLFKKSTTAIAIEDVNFCDELSWRELLSIMDTKAPVLMLFTGADARETLHKRRITTKHLLHLSSGNCETVGGSSSGSLISLKSFHSFQELPQVAVSTPTRKQTKSSLYGGLSDLDHGTWRETHKNSSLTAAVLLKKEQVDFSTIMVHPNCAYMKMPLLGEWEVADILKSTLEVDHIPQSLSLEVLEMSGGSIYWCESIAKYVKIIGIGKFIKQNSKPEEETIKFGSPTKSKFIKRLERHIIYHLESFSVKLQTIAKYASVIGDEFHLSVLLEILPAKVCISMHDLEKCINAISAQGILDLIDVEFKIYAFQNYLIRKTLMDYVLPSDAEIIHQKIARTLEKLFEDQLRHHYTSLSYHYAMSPVAERGLAFNYTVNAADQHIGIGNFSAGYLCLEYAASFVKYDMEMTILAQVTETALFDLKKQKKSKKMTTTITDDDVAHFEDMNEKFSSAIINSSLNGSEIMRSGSFQNEGQGGSFDSTAPSDDETIAERKKKLLRNQSAKNAKFMKMPSYSEKHRVNATKGSQRQRGQRFCPSCPVS